MPGSRPISFIGVRHHLVLFACLLSWSSHLRAQPEVPVGIGSRSRAAIFVEAVGGAGLLLSPGHRAELAATNLSGAVNGLLSPTRSARGGALSVGSLPAPDAVLFGVFPSEGSVFGGMTVEVLGLHLGGASGILTFDGVPATMTVLTPSSALGATVPSGFDAAGLNRGSVPIRVEPLQGASSEVRRAFAYLPALELTRPALRGCDAELRIRTARTPSASALFALWAGPPAQTLLPIAGGCGVFAMQLLEPVIPATFLDATTSTVALRFEIPDLPSFAGASFRVQAGFAEINGQSQSFTACLTNVLDIVIP